jgi:hypothetical protein
MLDEHYFFNLHVGLAKTANGHTDLFDEIMLLRRQPKAAPAYKSIFTCHPYASRRKNEKPRGHCTISSTFYRYYSDASLNDGWFRGDLLALRSPRPAISAASAICAQARKRRMLIIRFDSQLPIMPIPLCYELAKAFYCLCLKMVYFLFRAAYHYDSMF